MGQTVKPKPLHKDALPYVNNSRAIHPFILYMVKNRKEEKRRKTCFLPDSLANLRKPLDTKITKKSPTTTRRISAANTTDTEKVIIVFDTTEYADVDSHRCDVRMDTNKTENVKSS